MKFSMTPHVMMGYRGLLGSKVINDSLSVRGEGCIFIGDDFHTDKSTVYCKIRI